MTKQARFWDRHAAGYAKRPVPDEAVYQKKLEVTQTYLRPDMELLEFGCGTGSTAIVHAPFVKHIHAIDISPKMLAIGQSKADAKGITNITFEEKTIEALQQPDQSYDMVLGLSILHLLEDKEAAIAKVHRLLKPGGIFVTSTVCLGDAMKFFRFIGPIGKFLGLMPLVKVFSGQELKDSLTDAAFKIDYDLRPDIKSALFVVAQK